MIIRQIANLRLRIVLTKAMQGVGVLSFILCSLAMLFIFLGLTIPAEVTFGLSLLLLAASLLVSLCEIMISTRAIEIELEDLENRSLPNQPV
jgi:hypothetical protein